jgi:two-component system, sensor histidine kinase PdtaS
MIIFLKAPHNPKMDFYEQTRLLLTWRISLLFAFVILVITGISGLGKDTFFYYYLAVLILVFSCLLYMRVTKQYRDVSKLLFFGASSIIAGAVFSVRDVTHTIEILWMVIISLTAFFTLGKKWGYMFLALNAVLYTVYFNTLFYENLLNIENMTDLQWWIMSIEFMFAMFLIGVIMNLFFRQSDYTEEMRTQAFTELSHEKEKVEHQNKEMVVLLQEIHHRVKNNLQVIISLLRIQSQDLKSEEAKQSFHEAISRIMTMSLIHQKMYEHERLANISLKNYLETLIHEILSSSAMNEKVHLRLEIQTEEIGTRTIVPLALIINELVSNSLKHAFEDSGEIVLKFHSPRAGKLYLEYADSGTWKESVSLGFGLQLIDVFTEQLEGNYDLIKSDDGTRYIFEFTDLDYENQEAKFVNPQQKQSDFVTQMT